MAKWSKVLNFSFGPSESGSVQVPLQTLSIALNNNSKNELFFNDYVNLSIIVN